MDDLVAFLKARYDEDAEVAQAAADGDSGRWFVGDKWNVYRVEDEAPHDDVEENKLVVYGNVASQSEHIARHDPARVLAEVAAKRRLLGRYESAVSETNLRLQIDGTAPNILRKMALEESVREFAYVYKDHPDYREEWRP